jgi:hypothetical protein
MSKQNIQTLLLEWATTGVTNADVSFTLTDTTDSSTLFSSAISASSGSFFYTIPEATFDQTIPLNNFLNVEIDSRTALKNGDSSPVLDFTTCFVQYDTTGQLSLETRHYVTLSPNTGTLDTIHQTTLDRTEYYTNDAQIFWDTSDISGVTDVTNAEYIYSSDMRSEFCLFPEQTGGYLKVKRTPVALYEGVDGTVVLDTSVYSAYYGNDMTVFLSANDTSVGTLLGYIQSVDTKQALTRSKFGITTSFMQTLSDASFAGMTMSVVNDHTTDSRWQIFNSVFDYTPLTKALMDTTHSALVNDSTVPTIWRNMNTQHKARIKKGAYYVLEYYTKNDWWTF